MGHIGYDSSGRFGTFGHEPLVWYELINIVHVAQVAHVIDSESVHFYLFITDIVKFWNQINSYSWLIDHFYLHLLPFIPSYQYYRLNSCIYSSIDSSSLSLLFSFICCLICSRCSLFKSDSSSFVVRYFCMLKHSGYTIMPSNFPWVFSNLINSTKLQNL